jgi:hypothetical protein
MSEGVKRLKLAETSAIEMIVAASNRGSRSPADDMVAARIELKVVVRGMIQLTIEDCVQCDSGNLQARNSLGSWVPKMIVHLGIRGSNLAVGFKI